MTSRAATVVDIRDDAASDELADALSPTQVPPNALDSEAIILSALLIGDETAERQFWHCAEAGLSAKEFYASANAHVWDGIQAARMRHGRWDAALVAAAMRDARTLQLVGGAPYLAQLVDCTPAAANLMLHVGEVVEKARQRRLIAAMQAAAVKMRHGELSHEGARVELKRHFEEEKKR